MSEEEANSRFNHARISEKTSHRDDRIFREKTSQRIDAVEFLDHHRFHVDVKNHYRCVIFFIKRRDVKHRIRFLDLVSSQRAEKTFRASLSSRLLRLTKSTNDELLHEKRH
jgi:hypothetical protein